MAKDWEQSKSWLELIDSVEQVFRRRYPNAAVWKVYDGYIYLDRATRLWIIGQKDSAAAEASGIERASHLAFELLLDDGCETVALTTCQSAAVRALSPVLDNARKFTAPAEAYGHQASSEAKQRVVLRLSAVDNGVQFIVEDTGIGIPATEVEHIFDEFVQLNEYYDGTGIGLTVARSLARRLGGDIKLDTTYTGGARFVMTLY